MANVVALNAYQFNQHPITLGTNTSIALPTTGCALGNCVDSPTHVLSTGINVYSFAQTASGDKYYFQETFAALVTKFNT